MPKVLVTEAIHPAGPDFLRAQGYEVVLADKDMDVIRRELVDSDAVIVRVVKFPGEFLATAKRLKVINKHGVGYDNIDVEYCKGAGIAVTSAPNLSTPSVAEHACALMLALAKNVIPISVGYKEAGFKIRDGMEAVELNEKTLGLVGTGRIGSYFAQMCRLGFGMRVVAYDPYTPKAPEGIALLPNVEDVLREADVLSLHCVLTDETRKLINKERLALMKPSAILINCARGPIVDEAALIEALKAGKLAGAGLDVTDPAPVPPDSDLFKLPNVIVTPHYAPETNEAAYRVSRVSAENVDAILNGREPANRIV